MKTGFYIKTARRSMHHWKEKCKRVINKDELLIEGIMNIWHAVAWVVSCYAVLEKLELKAMQDYIEILYYLLLKAVISL